MKIKKLLLAAFLLFGFYYAYSQQPIAKGDKVLNLGIGLGSALYSGSYYSSTVPPISGSLEVIMDDQLFDGKGAWGLGGYLGYAASKYKYAGYDYGWKYSNIIIGPRGYLHYNLLEKLDTYIGAMLGYNIVSSTWYGAGTASGTASGSGVIFSGFLGARYFFNDNVAVMAELGSGIAYLNIGVALKF
jgi:hypothetical protein